MFLWLMLGIAAVVDLVLALRVRPNVRIDAPAEVFVGQTAALTIECNRELQGVEVAVDWPGGLTPEPREAGMDGAFLSVPFRGVRRGMWEIGAIWLTWPSRFALFELVPSVTPELSVAVVPDIRPVQSGEITVRVKSELYGVKENALIGEGSEFHQLRDFVPGMDIRSIDWKRSARHRSLVAKDMRAERNHHVVVCVDCGRLMREEIGGLPKLDHAINAALALAWASAVGGDLTGFFAYDARPRIYAPPEPGRLAFARIRSLSAEIDYAGAEANHTLAFAELNARSPRRSLLVVFSDFVDTTTAELLVENLGVLARRHAILFVAIRDPDEAKVGAGAAVGLDDVARAVVRADALAERRRVLEALNRLGITVLDCAPGTVTTRVISAYLDLKLREVI
ncbi:DUF58 domain-containing protein [Ovoidimarina sediminis]|uniref:DUF58 domain-containing protein n=1 Tax=Ovoidimarina sediminis TaxID=3079856 RepID=UPI00291269CE|nr:DUF58 domain-containing protein [Rhodophyticola sp. MJ-SS7]MDU8942602.1 DUF58 domain-containing protein [Rhodophyticola sp. MJ-SS7]